MTSHDKHLIFALSLSAVFISFNFYAVTVGIADGYYSQVTEWLRPLLRH